MSDISELPKLSNNTREYVGRVPFDEDKLDRKKLAEKLTTYLNRLNDGAVLAIDAPWGEGKTWFAKNWESDLQKNDYKTIYIDAFEQDYVDEPFMLITSEILNVIEKSNPIVAEIKKDGIEIVKALLPIGAKVLLNVTSKFLIGSSDISEDIKDAIDSGSDISAEKASEWIGEKIDEYTTSKTVTLEFKTKLADYAKEQENPIVIFIDELDRCKPTFAVNLIERIKHYFDVPNVVFILLLNKEQLENAIKGVYGINTDASKYLDKFINFYFNLPKNNSSEYSEQIKMTNFIKLTMLKYKFGNDNESFITWLNKWIPYFKLSLRDVEKCIALYAFAQPLKDLSFHISYFIAFKVKYPKLFNALKNSDLTAHGEAKNIIDDFIVESELKNDKHFKEEVLPLYSQWHQAHISNFLGEIGDKFKQYQINPYWSCDKKDYFKALANMIDIDIER